MSGSLPTYQVYHDDCIEIDRWEPKRVFDLIYLEPPTDFALETAEGLLSRVQVLLSHLHESGFLLVHLDHRQAARVKNKIDAFGLPFKGDLIWAYRDWPVKTRGLQNHHDAILVYSANAQYHKKREIIAHSVVAPSSNERAGYPGQKPLDLLKRIIRRLEEYHSIASILDPFMGSGTALVAGLELGKDVCGFDVSALACRIADKRLHQALPASRQMQFQEI